MQGVNKALIIGNVGQDPECREVRGDHTVCEFSVATNEGTKSNTHTEWHNIVAWNKTAEACRDYLKKGDAVYVEGRIRRKEWQDKEGTTRCRPTVVADRVVFLSKSRKPEDNRAEPASSLETVNDDLPF